MNVFVDTSVWSLAFRRDAPVEGPEVAFLARALESGDSLIVCDTDLTVIQVWWEEKYGALPVGLLRSL